MAAAFRPVNSSLTTTTITESTADDAMSPNSSSLRPSTAPHSQHPQSSNRSATPTRTNFHGTMAGQQPLPYSFPSATSAHHEPSENSSRRDPSQRSASAAKSPPRTSKDVDMDESDGETATVEDNPGSDDESVNADGSRSSKKKKSQRFYCTDYPPCNLSFTRSEHLARHIRKHTGERPFKCHCQRRFSRLDNLRQHAQTVHVNENIPVDSLAATGSRFQRQIRNDRTRQAGNRARASTGGSAGGPVRGHSKSLSTPNIPTIASVGPAYSMQADPRQRPTPIVMASDPRSRLSFDSHRSSFAGTLPFPQHSPDRFTPPSGYTAAQTSPRRGPYPMSSSHSRSQSLYSIDNRPPSRRLSVPSGPNPFQLGHGQAPGRPSFGPAMMNSPTGGALPSPNSGLMPSPILPNSDWSTRRDSISSSVGDEALRRRTWHIETGGPSGYPSALHAAINEEKRPDLLPPITRPASPTPRLPSIASLVSLAHRPATPPRQHLSSMDVDAQVVQRPVQLDPLQTDERRNLNMYDVSLQRGLGRLDIGPRTPPRENVGPWITEASRQAHVHSERPQMTTSSVRFEEPPHPSYTANAPGRSYHQHTMSAPNLVPSRENRRHGWYHGPASASYEGAQQSPQEIRGHHVDRMHHPNLNGFSGFPAKDQSSQMQQQERPNNSDPLRRLEALVAVATSEGSTATAY